MSDFIESEAEESEEEFAEKDLKPKKTQRFMEEDDEEEEENTEDQDERGNLRGLIDDGDEEEEEEEEGGGGGGGGEGGGRHASASEAGSDSEEEVRHRRKKRNYDDYLDDDDLDLIEENLGVKVKRRKKKYDRVKTLDDDEEDDDEKDLIADEIFHGDADGELEDGEAVDEPLHHADDDEEGEDEESDIDDFIVDDDGQPITKKRGKKFSGYTDAALQEAQEIFGGDFDFADFDADAYDQGEEEEEDQDEGGWDRPKKQTKRRQGRKSIFEIYEPSELESSHMTDQDNDIRSTDMPERFQLRSIPVKPAEDDELEEEAEWIFRHGFSTLTISMQESTDYLDRGTTTNFSRKGPSTIAKIKEALNFMRNQQFEVPFIAFYRKEYVEPELNINDLWKVWQWDEKWTQLKTRKQNLTRLFRKMQSYQFEQISADPDKPLADGIRPLDTADMERLKDVQTLEELGDVYNHFLLYYGRDIPKMQNTAKSSKKRLKKIKEVTEDGEEEEVEVEEEEDQKGPDLKLASRRDMYSICQSVGLDGLAKKFGLTPEQFGENLRDSYQRHETEQFPAEPVELSKDYVCSQFSNPEAVLEGTRYMVAMQLAREPLVRHVLRQTFQERAKINIKPTKKGKKEVDEAHFAYSFKYLKNKPVKELNGDQFLKMCLAEEEGLLTIDICIDLIGVKGYAGDQTYFDEIKQFYYRDEFSHQVQEWNRQRTLAIERALTQFLYPQMAKELKSKLITEAKESIIRSCCRRLYNWLKVAPYRPDQQVEEDDDLMDESQGKGIRVLGVAYAPSRDTPVFCALINGEGEVVDFLRLPYFMKRRNAFREDEREKKAHDVENLKRFLSGKKPHVVAVAGESRDAQMIMEDIKRAVGELEQESSLPAVGVELVDNELATLYMNSKRSETDFRDYPPLLRQAVSIARKIQDPLMEYAQVCSSDDDILCLKLHPLQEHVVKEDLLCALHCEFINRVNEVGVDVNKSIAHPHTQSLVQYVCGLGARKGSQLLKILKQNNTRLENRTQLVTMCHMGPKVFINCAGFIKIDTASLGDSTDSYIEVLDGSRVHPETYEWARKMAVDALEYDESAEDANPAGALEEILENPERLKDLDLDAFAEELERQGYGNKGITLYDIRAELSCRYKDLRVAYRVPNTEEVFNLLTKETPETFYIGKLITSIVTGIAHRRPQGESYDQAIRNDSTGLWQCPFCQQDNFPELSEVWNHFDSGSCPGQAIGVRSRLDNGVQGFIPTKFLSDKVVKHPEERVKVGMTVHCRIMKIDIEKFSVDLTCRTSDLMDKANEWKLPKDTYYDFDTESEDQKQEEELKKKQQRTPYIKRVIAHPNFHNISFNQAEKMMETLDQGDLIIRPSSKGENHLTVTWKVADGIYQHVDVREEGKENAFSLGHTLWINSEEFEDLDEITARYIQPMASFARDLLGHKYFQDGLFGNKEKMEELLVKTKREKPTFIPYFLSACKDLPGKFILGYQPRGKPRVEYVTITPDGFRYRSQIFPTVNGLFRWFKDHYQEPVPGITPSNSSRTRTPASLNATPANINIADLTRAVNALPRNMTSQMFSAIAAVTGQGQGQNPVAAHVSEEQLPEVRIYTVNTEWSQSDLVRGSRLRYSQQWTLITDSNDHKSIRTVLPPGPCVPLSGELLSGVSPVRGLRAVVREISGHQLLEIWDHQGLRKCLNLTAFNKHGRVYDDAQFGCLSWSECENRLLYVAEKSKNTIQTYDDESACRKDRSVYSEDWGEALTNKSVPVICVVNLQSGSVGVLQGVPPAVSPGQALWAPGSRSVFFVGWYHAPFRLGLKFCSNRRSALFKLELDGNCERLSGDNVSVSCPRLSPDGSTLIYLQGRVFGPHNQCLSLQQLDLKSGKTSTLLDVVHRPQTGEFAGVYEALPPCCWSADGQRVMFSSARRNWKDLFMVDRSSNKVTSLSDSFSDLSVYGSWKLLTVQKDLMVVCCSSPNTPPTLRAGFLPSAGEAVTWRTLQKPVMTFDFHWKVVDVTPPPEENNAHYSGLDFGAVLVKPSRPFHEAKTPLVVFIHGGPHSQFSAEWNSTTAGLTKLGLAVLMVNYRGSTGFGQDSILSLIGQIGSQDVKDVQRAVLTALKRDTTLDPERLAVIGGSHGGFLSCHLVGQYPEFYRACAARNPVINAATLVGTSDIVDWRYSSMGFQYSYDQIPTAEALAAMLEKSPITHAAQIKAPVLLMLGGRDRRVSPHQGLELYKALKSRASTVRLLWFPEDGHSLSRVDTQADCFLNTVLWLHQHL